MICTLIQYCSGDQIEKSEMGRACSTNGGRGEVGKTRRTWEEDIKMDLQEVGCEGMDWIELARVRDRWRTLVNAVMNLGSIKCGQFHD